MRLFHLSTCLVCVRTWEHVNNIIGKCFSEVKGWRQTGRSTWVLRPGSSECLATTSDMLGNGDSPPCIPKHVSCVEASCLLMPSTCLVCSSDVCSAFYFLRAVFEMLHGLQKGLSTAAVVALPLWHHSILGSWRYECPTFCGNHGSNPMMFPTLYDQCQGYFGCLHFWWNWLYWF